MPETVWSLVVDPLPQTLSPCRSQSSPCLSHQHLGSISCCSFSPGILGSRRTLSGPAWWSNLS